MVGPDTSLWTVAASSVFGLILAAQDEYRDSPLRINEMRLHCFLKRHSGGRGCGTEIAVGWGVLL